MERGIERDREIIDVGKREQRGGEGAMNWEGMVWGHANKHY